MFARQGIKKLRGNMLFFRLRMSKPAKSHASKYASYTLPLLTQIGTQIPKQIVRPSNNSSSIFHEYEQYGATSITFFKGFVLTETPGYMYN